MSAPDQTIVVTNLSKIKRIFYLCQDNSGNKAIQVSTSATKPATKPSPNGFAKGNTCSVAPISTTYSGSSDISRLIKWQSDATFVGIIIVSGTRGTTIVWSAWVPINSTISWDPETPITSLKITTKGGGTGGGGTGGGGTGGGGTGGGGTGDQPAKSKLSIIDIILIIVGSIIGFLLLLTFVLWLIFRKGKKTGSAFRRRRRK